MIKSFQYKIMVESAKAQQARSKTLQKNFFNWLNENLNSVRLEDVISLAEEIENASGYCPTTCPHDLMELSCREYLDRYETIRFSGFLRELQERELSHSEIKNFLDVWVNEIGNYVKFVYDW